MPKNTLQATFDSLRTFASAKAHIASNAPERGRWAEGRLDIKTEVLLLAITLMVFSTAVYAQRVPSELVAAVLSPIPVLILCIALGILRRSVRVATRHIGLFLLWIVLLALAAYFIENDYVIWTPLALFVLHSAILFVLVLIEVTRRIGGDGKGR